MKNDGYLASSILPWIFKFLQTLIIFNGNNLINGHILWKAVRKIQAARRQTKLESFIHGKLFLPNYFNINWPCPSNCYIVQPYELDHIRAWSKKPKSFLLKLPIASWKKISNFFVLPFFSSLKRQKFRKRECFHVCY